MPKKKMMRRKYLYLRDKYDFNRGKIERLQAVKVGLKPDHLL